MRVWCLVRVTVVALGWLVASVALTDVAVAFVAVSVTVVALGWLVASVRPRPW